MFIDLNKNSKFHLEKLTNILFSPKNVYFTEYIYIDYL